MSVLLIVGPKCTLAASLVSHSEYVDGKDGQTDGRQTVKFHYAFR